MIDECSRQGLPDARLIILDFGLRRTEELLTAAPVTIATLEVMVIAK